MNFTKDLNQKENELRLNIIHKFCKNPNEKIDVIPQYKSLIEKKVITTENNKIKCIYPISSEKTNKLVYTNKSKDPLFAMCAIDAIGIYYSTGLNILILSEDELTKEKIKLEIKDDKIINHSKSDIYISYKDVCEKEDCDKNCCPYIHFFTSKNNAENYLNSLPNKESHKILNLKEAKEISKQLFKIHNLS
ncbi:organomercurial lyase [Staphylococcus aureus]|uniref:organomercurial lyase n=1 Tax=Staphylococcus aureus TaxID=1280 RepID=UPI00301D7C89